MTRRFFVCAGALGVTAALVSLPDVARAAEPQAAPSQVTFTRNVAPILQQHCQNCHHAGSIAPMSLMTFQETRPWARSIKARVANREMPPWYIDRTIGVQRFKDDPSLTDAEIATIVSWVDQGTPQGNPADLPAPLKFDDTVRWHIDPDLIVTLPKEQVIGPADPDSWRDFIIDTGLKEDRYIQAVETKPSPGAQRVVHHAASSMIFENDGGDDRGGFLNEYAIGKNADLFPPDAGRLIKAGTKLRVNMHYHSVGEEIKDQTSIGLKFFPKDYKPKYTVVTQHVGDSFEESIDIPAGESNARTDGYFTLPQAALVQSFQPHMHNRGKRMCVEAILPTGSIQTLSCAKHNFAWMLVYNYADDAAPLLPKGTILHVVGWHDNSAANKYNPDPRNWVGFGNRSIDDMSFAWMSFHYMSDGEYAEMLQQRRAARAGTAQNQQQ
jgi:mono/diheme cytochrome c family protein